MGTTKHQKFDKIVAWLVCAGLVIGLGWAGTSCLTTPEDRPRPASAEEAGRLAQIRTTGVAAGPVAMRLDLPETLGGAGLDGYIDWSVPMVHAATYLDAEPTGLVQAVPGLIASHSGAVDTDPAAAPATGWTVRRMQSSESQDVDRGQAAIDILLSALLALGSPEPADAGYLQDTGVWLKEGIIDGAKVDVIRAPLLLQPEAPTDGDEPTPEAAPEAVFWVDHDSRLRRLQIDPAGNGLATIELLLQQDQVPPIEPVDVLGGPAVEPRELSEAEVTRLAGLRYANSQRGARLDLELPVADDELVTAQGWVDWRSSVIYLAVDAPGKDNDGLLFVLPAGAATLSMPVDGLPPQSPPVEGWTAQRWDDRIETGEAGDLDTLVYKVLVMASLQSDTPQEVTAAGTWLREDTLAEATVDVVEFATPGDPEADPGAAPFRYWIDQDSSTLHRIQLRTNGFGLGHVDLTDEQPPMMTIPYGIVSALSS